MVKRKEETISPRQMAACLHRAAHLLLTGWKYSVEFEPVHHGDLWAVTRAYPLDRIAKTIIYTPLTIKEFDSQDGNPAVLISMQKLAVHEIIHAVIELPFSGLEEDVSGLLTNVPAALADDFRRRWKAYTEGIVNALSTAMVAALGNKLD